MQQMTGPLRRIIRAKEHLDTLDSEIRTFMASDFYHVEVYDDPDSSGYIYQPYLLKSIPIRWGILVGEFIHGLRSALDNIAWSLAITKDDKVEFPIFIDDIPGFTRKLKKLREDVRSDVQAIQPYNRTNREKHRAPLWVLHRMDIIDKHRVILPSVMKFHIVTAGKANEAVWVDLGITSLNKGDIVFKHAMPLSLQINFKPKVFVEILFDISSKPAVKEDPIRIDREDLFGMYEYIRNYAYPRFAKFLDPINGFE